MAIPMISRFTVFSALSDSLTTELHTLAIQNASPYAQTYLFEMFGNAASDWKVQIQGKVNASGRYRNWDFIEIAVGGAAAIQNGQIEVKGTGSKFYLVWNAPEFMQLKAVVSAGTLTVYGSLTSQPSTQWLKTDANGNLLVVMAGVVSATIANLAQEGKTHNDGDPGLEVFVVDRDGKHRAIRLDKNGNIPVSAVINNAVELQYPSPVSVGYGSYTITATAGFLFSFADSGMPGTKPAAAKSFVGSLETASVRVRSFGGAPTASEGQLVNVGDPVYLSKADLEYLQLIRTGGTSGVLKGHFYDVEVTALLGGA